jgi:hypothetical protein
MAGFRSAPRKSSQGNFGTLRSTDGTEDVVGLTEEGKKYLESCPEEKAIRAFIEAADTALCDGLFEPERPVFDNQLANELLAFLW